MVEIREKGVKMMGLDITAYRNIKIVEGEEPEYYFANSGFKQSNMTNIENKEIQIDFDESFDFRAGSYGGYGGYDIFKNELCLASNNITAEQLWSLQDETLKFYWLINFSDCEGYIGTSYCKILYDEFVKYEEEVKIKLDEYYHKKYDDFKEAFRVGESDGLVNFHYFKES